MKDTTVRVKAKRMTGAERKRIKRAQKAKQELLLCQQVAAFHKAYLEIELANEEIKYDELQERLAALQAVVATVQTTETVQTVEVPAVAEVEEPQVEEPKVEEPKVEEPQAEEIPAEETVAEETTEETEEAEPAPAQ